MSNPPLQGVRVLDLTVVWAGPYATQLLADLGAEVIRIESTQFFQSTTRGVIPRPPKEMVAAMGPVGGGFPDSDPGERPWNRHALFNCHARNKRSMTVDLAKPEGKEIFLKLLESSDVFVENNEYNTVFNLGIDYESARRHKPDIIYVSSNGMGHTGPWKDFIGYGLQFEAIFGHTSIIGYPDMDPSGAPQSVVADGAAGPGTAFAVLAALKHRNETGEGQYIDFAQGENVINHLAEPYLDYSLNGRVAGPTGARQSFAAPQGSYPTDGDDEWIVITVGSDAEWMRLTAVAGHPEWGDDPRFASFVARREHHDELDRLLSQWTRQHNDKALFLMLQAAGIRAGHVMHEKHAFDDPHLNDRGFFVELTTEDTGSYRYPGADWRLSETPVQFWRGPVMLGEDNEYVYKEILGVSDDEYDRLVAEGHIGTELVENVRT